MTTKVTVSALHGWPVDVTQLNPKTGEDVSPTQRVLPNTDRTFYVHSGADLRIHEVQPDELAQEPPVPDIKKSSHEWMKDPRFARIVIIDPDGWDRWDYEVSMAELITEEEFRKRVSRSTQMFVRDLDV